MLSSQKSLYRATSLSFILEIIFRTPALHCQLSGVHVLQHVHQHQVGFVRLSPHLEDCHSGIGLLGNVVPQNHRNNVELQNRILS